MRKKLKSFLYGFSVSIACIIVWVCAGAFDKVDSSSGMLQIFIIINIWTLSAIITASVQGEKAGYVLLDWIFSVVITVVITKFFNLNITFDSLHDTLISLKCPLVTSIIIAIFNSFGVDPIVNGISKVLGNKKD